MFESLLFRPNFPKAPKRSFDFYNFPNDLITDNRNYYTEIQFYSYDSGFKIPTEYNPPQREDRASTTTDMILSPEFIDRLKTSNYNGEFAVGQGKQGAPLGVMRLPLPQRINDTQTYSWGEGSAVDIAGSLLQNSIYMQRDPDIANRLFNLSNLGQVIGQGAGVISGFAINPMMFQQFQRPNFREFQFQWTLAPRTRTESATIASMITMLKRAAAPDNYGLFISYPLVAMIKFYPNNLTGHPSNQVGGVFLKPCIIQAISVDHTPVGGPAFFKGPEGAPVVVGLSISVKELQLWYREDYNIDNTDNTPERYISESGRINPERTQ